MFKKFFESIYSIDKYILSLMNKGIKLAFIVCLLANVILLLHILNPVSHIVYETGAILFKSGLFLLVDFCICGFVFDKLKKQMI